MAPLPVLLSGRIIAYYGHICASVGHPSAYVLFRRTAGPARQPQRVPNLLRVSILPCRHLYSGGSGDCSRLILRRPLWPSPLSDRLGTHKSASAGSRSGGVTKLQCSRYATARKVAGPAPARTFTTELSPPLGHPNGCRLSLPGQPVNSRGRTFTGKTRGPMGCDAKTPRAPRECSERPSLSHLTFAISAIFARNRSSFLPRAKPPRAPR